MGHALCVDTIQYLTKLGDDHSSLVLRHLVLISNEFTKTYTRNILLEADVSLLIEEGVKMLCYFMVLP